MIPIAPSLSAVKLGRGRPRKNEKSRKLSVVPMDSQSCYPTGVKKGRGRPRKRTVSATTHMPQTETSTAHKGIIAEQRSTFPTVTTDSAPITSAIHQTKRGRGRPRKITQLQKRTPSEHSEHDGEHDACHVSADEEHISPRRDYSANYFANELNQTPSLQLRLEQDRSSPKFNEDSEIVDAEQQASDSDGEIRGRRRDPKFITGRVPDYSLSFSSYSHSSFLTSQYHARHASQTEMAASSSCGLSSFDYAFSQKT